jgi:hypothetical protein
VEAEAARITRLIWSQPTESRFRPRSGRTYQREGGGRRQQRHSCSGALCQLRGAGDCARAVCVSDCLRATSLRLHGARRSHTLPLPRCGAQQQHRRRVAAEQARRQLPRASRCSKKRQHQNREDTHQRPPAWRTRGSRCCGEQTRHAGARRRSSGQQSEKPCLL